MLVFVVCMGEACDHGAVVLGVGEVGDVEFDLIAACEVGGTLAEVCVGGDATPDDKGFGGIAVVAKLVDGAFELFDDCIDSGCLEGRC